MQKSKTSKIMFKDKDFYDIREHCINGIRTNKERRQFWRVLLDIPDNFNKIPKIDQKHPDYFQVEKDVNRSYNSIKDIQHKKHMRKKLTNVIMNVLQMNGNLSYYQGFHDIATIILTFCDEELAIQFLYKIASGHLLPFLQKDFSGFKSFLEIVFPLLEIIDTEIYDHLQALGVGYEFAMPYLLTWYSREAKTKQCILRIFDFFICTHPAMPLYLLVTLITNHKESLLRDCTSYDDIDAKLKDLIEESSIDKYIHESIQMYIDVPPFEIFLRFPGLKISKDLVFLNPNFVYPYESTFYPRVAPFPLDLYHSRLDEDQQKDDSFVVKIISVLAFLGAIGIQMLDI